MRIPRAVQKLLNSCVITVFYDQLCKCLKLGMHVDSTSRIEVAEPMRYHSS